MENILEIRDLNVTIQHPLTKENTRILKNLSECNKRKDNEGSWRIREWQKHL